MNRAEDVFRGKLEADLLEYVHVIGASSDDVARVLRLHSMCEYFLEQVILSRMIDGSVVVEDDRFTFHHKLQLAKALGGVDSATHAALRKLTKLRNRCAHERRPVIRPADLLEVGNASGPHFEKVLAETEDPHREFRAVAWAIFTNLSALSSAKEIFDLVKGNREA